MRILFAAIVLCASVMPAAAGWEVHAFTDQLTDRKQAFATVTSNGVTLRVACLNGQRTPDIVLADIIGWPNIGVSYRFDDGAVVPRISPVSSDGRALWLWLAAPSAAVDRLTRAKRLRVEIHPRLGEPLFADFDLTGARAAVSQVVCR